MDSKAPPAFRDVCTINQPLDPLFPPHSYFIRYFLFARSPTISLPHLHHLHHARTILCALPPSPPRLLFSVYPPSFSTFWSLFPPFPSRHALPHHSIFSVLLLCSSGMRVASSPHKRYFDSFIDRVSTRFALYLYTTHVRTVSLRPSLPVVFILFFNCYHYCYLPGLYSHTGKINFQMFINDFVLR